MASAQAAEDKCKLVMVTDAEAKGEASDASTLTHAAGFKQCLQVIETVYANDPDRKAALTRALMESYLKSIQKLPLEQGDGLRRTNSPLPGLPSENESDCDGTPSTCETTASPVAEDPIDVESWAACMPEEDLTDLIGDPQPFRPETDVSISGQWRLPHRYQLGKMIGRGVYGEVRIARDQKREQQVAVKRMNDFWKSSGDCKRILREVTILSRLHHSNTVHIYDLPLPPDLDNFTDLYIVMELCDTSLIEICKHPTGVTLPQARKLIHGILLGCSYLHSAGIYHRDLKPGNCVVNRDCTAKICDFNLSRVVDGTPDDVDEGKHSERAPAKPTLTRTLTGFVCTPWYRAPEVILSLGYSEAVDVWSAGCIFAEIFSALNEEGRQPNHRTLFPGSGSRLEDLDGKPSKRDQLNLIFDILGTPSRSEELKLPKTAAKRLSAYERRKGSGLHAWIPSEAGEAALKLVEQMLRFQPETRITMADALQHEFLVGVSRSPDDQHPASGPLDTKFDDDSIRSGQPMDNDLHAQVRQQLLAVIRQFHPDGLLARQRSALVVDMQE